MKTYENLVEKTKYTKEVFAGKMLHAYDDTITLPNDKEAIPLTDLVDQVLDGTITDGKTQVALLKAAEKLGVIRKQSK